MDCVFLLYSCMTHNLSLHRCQTLWISPCWVLAIFCILKNILKLYYQSKITWKQFNLLGSCIHECSVYSPLLRQDQFEYSTQCSTNYETFPVWPFPILREQKALFLPLASESFLICSFCRTLQANPEQKSGILSMQHSSLWYCLQTLAALLSLHPPPRHLNSDSLLAST